MKEKTKQILLWVLVLAALAVIVLVMYRTGFFAAMRTKDGLAQYISATAPWSHLVYFLIQLASVIVAPIPSNITAAVGAVLFGLWPSFLLTWAAVASDSALVFLLARALGQKFADQFVSQKLSDKYLDVIRRKRDVFLALAFLFPFFPDDLLCILAGLTDIPFRRFFILVLLTRPWGLLVACAVGSSTLSIPLWGMALLGIVGLVLFLLAMKYGDRVEAAVLERLKK